MFCNNTVGVNACTTSGDDIPFTHAHQQHYAPMPFVKKHHLHRCTHITTHKYSTYKYIKCKGIFAHTQ